MKRPRKNAGETAPIANYWLDWALKFNEEIILSRQTPEFLAAYKRAHGQRLGLSEG